MPDVVIWSDMHCGIVLVWGCAQQLDALIYRGNSGYHHPGYTFIPASVETCGYLGKPLVCYLNTLSEVAAARGSAVTMPQNVS